MQEFDFPYKIVSDAYRAYVTPRPKKNLKPVTDKMLLELLAGKTILLDMNVPINGNADFGPLKSLYAFFNVRGMRLRMHLFDVIDEDVFRGVLLWAESFYKVYRCDRCKRIIGVAGETKPATEGCPANRWHNTHYWRVRHDGYMGRTHKQPSNRSRAKNVS